MPYRYLEEIAIADVAFEAWGETREELFSAAADAMMNLMVADLKSIECRERRKISLENEKLDLLLFDFLQELIFYKDAEKLFLKIESIRIEKSKNLHCLEAETAGEEIDPQKHELGVDVKAVTLHGFRVKQTAQGWQANVILDV